VPVDDLGEIGPHSFKIGSLFGDQAIEIDPTSGAILSTLAIPGADFRYGSGLAFRSSATGLGYLDFTYGNAFDAGVQEVRSLAIDTGELQCSGINFDGPNFNSLLGICYNASQSSLLAVSSTSLVQISATQPAIYPPADLVCLADGEGAVNLDWRNCGPGGGGLYSLLRITRNGRQIMSLRKARAISACIAKNTSWLATGEPHFRGVCLGNWLRKLPMEKTRSVLERMSLTEWRFTEIHPISCQQPLSC
jgi:hypothetical protein